MEFAKKLQNSNTTALHYYIGNLALIWGLKGEVNVIIRADHMEVDNLMITKNVRHPSIKPLMTTKPEEETRGKSSVLH